MMLVIIGARKKIGPKENDKLRGNGEKEKEGKKKEKNKEGKNRMSL